MMLEIWKSRGCAVIYAPDLAEEIGYARDTIFFFSWQESAILRVYNSPSAEPTRIDLTKRFGYSPADVAKKVVREENLSRDRQPCTDAKYWYGRIQNIKRQWFSEEGVEGAKPPDTEVKKDDSAPTANSSSSRPSNDLSNIQAYLMEHRSDICRYFYTTDDQWRDLTQHRSNLHAERVWVFLIGCGYALGGEQGIKTLTKILTGSELEQPEHPIIWFESLPLPPRMEEKHTHLDLALGAIAIRGTTANGIGFDNSAPSWICFCEAKLDSDISPGVTHDPNRNQLARVIENAICFQDSGNYADDVYVTVITPRAFRDKRPLLEEKFNAYKENPEILIDELTGCRLTKRSTYGWLYPPDLAQRVMNSLKLRWVYFEDLVANLASSDISKQSRNLWGRIT